MFYIIPLVLIGQMSLYHFVATLDQKVISRNETNGAYEKTFLIPLEQKRLITLFFVCDLLDIYAS